MTMRIRVLALSVLLAALPLLACTRPLPEQMERQPTNHSETALLPAPDESGSYPQDVQNDGEVIGEEASGFSGEQEDLSADSYAGDSAPLAQQPSTATTPSSQGTGPLPGSEAPAGGWRLRIPQIGVDAPIVPVGLDPDGALAAPEGPDVVGWYRYGPTPGQRGNVLLDGHVDWTSRQTGIPHGAVFWNLTKLSPGSQITITEDTRDYVYAVSEKLRFHWQDAKGASVLQPSTDARITLITCGGAFDRATRNYSMRDVVIAHLVN
jgi:sortase (surface protein transpeptidase)